MNNCEVMLNDVKYSKRLHTQIIEEKLQQKLILPLDVLVVSVQFWPEMKELTLKVPEEVNFSFILWHPDLSYSLELNVD